MNYKNIFEINNNIEHHFHDDIIHLLNKNYDINSNIKIKFIKTISISFIIGFSMNLKYINIIHNNTTININKISNLNLNILINDTIQIIPDNTNCYYEIYIKINNTKTTNNLHLVKNTILNKTKNNNWFYGIKKIIIITTKFIKSIGEYFKIFFKQKNILCEIKYELKISDCINTYNAHNTLFIILYNNLSNYLLPNKFIFYQIEQTESIFLTDKKYLHRLKYMCMKAEYVWQFTSITSQIYDDYCKTKLKWMPIPYKYVNFNDEINWNELKYDILFYGHKNARRYKILNELNKHFNIKICYGIYGDKKNDYIKKSKIILNLHYYDNAGLETCRFNEILNYNKIIISENSLLDTLNNDLYNDIIITTNCIKDDLTNINDMINILKIYLNENTYFEKINKNKILVKNLEKKIESILFEN